MKTESLYTQFESIVKDPTIRKGNDTNILDAIHLCENDHTKTLWQILSYRKDGRYPYLVSFFSKVLGLRYDNYFDVDATLQKGSGPQQPAMESKKESKGYIDLLLKGDDTVAIIENKINDAGDSANQMVSYNQLYDGRKNIIIIYVLICDGGC